MLKEIVKKKAFWIGIAVVIIMIVGIIIGLMTTRDSKDSGKSDDGIAVETNKNHDNKENEDDKENADNKKDEYEGGTSAGTGQGEVEDDKTPEGNVDNPSSGGDEGSSNNSNNSNNNSNNNNSNNNNSNNNNSNSNNSNSNNSNNNNSNNNNSNNNNSNNNNSNNNNSNNNNNNDQNVSTKNVLTQDNYNSAVTYDLTNADRVWDAQYALSDSSQAIFPVADPLGGKGAALVFKQQIYEDGAVYLGADYTSTSSVKSQAIKVIPGQTYKVKFDYYTVGNTGSMPLKVELTVGNTINNKMLSNTQAAVQILYMDSQTSLAMSRWATKEATITVPKNIDTSVYTYLMLRVTYSAGANAPGAIYFDNVKVEKGSSTSSGVTVLYEDFNIKMAAGSMRNKLINPYYSFFGKDACDFFLNDGREEKGTQTALSSQNISASDGKLIMDASGLTTISFTDEYGRVITGDAYVGAEVRGPAFTYGYAEIYAKLDVCSGVCPAFWLIGNSAGGTATHYYEIDVFECLGAASKDNGMVKSSLIEYTKNPNGSYSAMELRDYELLNGHTSPYIEGFGNDGKFHKYAVEWTEDYIYILYDDVRVMRRKIEEGQFTGEMTPVLTIYSGVNVRDNGKETGSAVNVTAEEWANHSSFEIDYMKISSSRFSE